MLANETITQFAGKGSLSVLFVEDSKLFVKVVSEFLVQEKEPSLFELITAGSYAEAVDLIKQREFDLIILDLTLPDVTGLNTFYQLQREAPLTPIILLTNLDDEKVALKAVASGAQDYLIKAEITKGLLIRSIRYAIERKKSELIIAQQRQALVHSAKLSALGEMASGIAHEINNPIATIFWQAGHLNALINSGKLDLSVFQSSVMKIRATSERISKIVASLRNLCRDGSMDPCHEVAWRKILDETFEVCREKFTQKGVQLCMEENGLNPILICRATEVGQSILNILNNAFDAVQFEENRWIRIELKTVGEQLQISIIDSGRGLTPEAKKKIFQPFFSTKGVGRGLGLGLSLARKMIEGHGWALKFDDRSENTRFYICIPANHFRFG